MSAVDASISALYPVCLLRAVTCTAKMEATLPHTHLHSQSPLNDDHPGVHCVRDSPLNPMKPLPLTDAQRLTRGYCGLMQRKSTVDGRRDRRTDSLLPCWQTAGSRREAAANQWKGWLLFLGRVCRDQRSTARRKGRTNVSSFAPTVYRAPREV